MDINCHDDTNTTPLHLAAWGSHLEAVRLLAKRGALVTLQDASGDQPLHWAATTGHTAVGVWERAQLAGSNATAMDACRCTTIILIQAELLCDPMSGLRAQVA